MRAHARTHAARARTHAHTYTHTHGGPGLMTRFSLSREKISQTLTIQNAETCSPDRFNLVWYSFINEVIPVHQCMMYLLKVSPVTSAYWWTGTSVTVAHSDGPVHRLAVAYLWTGSLYSNGVLMDRSYLWAGWSFSYGVFIDRLIV